MKIKVLVIAPYQGLLELMKNLEPELMNFELVVHVADLAESLMLLDMYKEEHFDFIISRGGTANTLKKNTCIPVIEIEISGYDILRILTLLKEYNQKIEMIGFKNIIQGFESISKLIDIDITYTIIKQKEEVNHALFQAKQHGARIIVGDTITVRMAKDIGLQGVLITSGKESILEAFYKAREMHKVHEQLKSKTTVYQNVLNELESAVVVISETGAVKFANQSFYQILNLESESSKEASLFDAHPLFKKILVNSKHQLQQHYQLLLSDRDMLYDIKLGAMTFDSQEPLYYFELKSPDIMREKREATIVFPYKNEAFPELVISSELVEDALAICKGRIDASKPISILGEIGTGKRLFVSSLFKSFFPNGSSLIEINLNRIGMKKFNQVVKMLEIEAVDTLILIRGIENTTVPQQQKLFNSLRGIKSQLVFSFVGNQEILHNNEFKLDQELLQVINEQLIYFPPLRERVGELKEMIQSFIVQFNEIYGKQVVGVRQEVLEVLQEHSWEGNLLELKKVIQEFVKRSEDEYISVELLDLLDTEVRNENYNCNGNGTFINLDQPLEKIEAEIIDIIMKQEKMNQSKVAKRLGINRSTLWRKLKKE
jgi:transcriptional regulator, propionate catabolism operon regulatory protein